MTDPLREPTFLILAALAPQPLHGYAIIGEVAELSGGRLSLRPGTLYGALDRLADEKLLEPDREEVVDGLAAPLLPADRQRGRPAGDRGGPAAVQRRRGPAAAGPAARPAAAQRCRGTHRPGGAQPGRRPGLSLAPDYRWLRADPSGPSSVRPTQPAAD